MTTTPAILNRMRLNNSRLNYYQPHIYLTINGTRRETSTLLGSYATITKGRGPDGSRASLRVKGFTPSVGQSVVIGVGTLNNRLFGGVVQAVDQPKNETRSTALYDLTCVGYRWLLDRRLVFRAYANTAGDAIIRDLVSTYSSGFTTAHVQPLATITSVVFDGVTIGEALDRLKTLIDGFDWYVDDYQDLHAFTGTELLVQPSQVTGSTIDRDYGFFRTLDLSQVRTRVYVAGQTTTVASDAAAADTSLLVADSALFTSAGGKARADGQLLTYSGLTLGQASAPTVALGYYDGANAVAVSGSAFSGGAPPTVCTVTTTTAHGLATNDRVLITGCNNDTNGPRIVTSTPTSVTFTYARAAVGAPAAGSSGWVRKCLHATAVETRGPVCTITFSSAHSLGVGQQFWIGFTVNQGGAYPYNGYHSVETVPSSTTITFTMSGHPADLTALYDNDAVAALLAAQPGLLAGVYQYKVSWSADSAESLASAASGTVMPAAVAALDASEVTLNQTTGGSMAVGTYYYGFSAVTADGETAVTTVSSSVSVTAGNNAVNVGFPFKWLNDTRISAINVWRAPSGTLGALRYASTYTVTQDSSVWSAGTSAGVTHKDTPATASQGGPIPTTNTAGGAVVLSGLTVNANARTSQRTIYRTTASGTTYRLVGTVANNVDTTTVDAASDTTQANGAVEPTTGLATLTGIPASGTGAITAAILAGASVGPVVQVDDTAAQTALAALEGGDGIREHLLQVSDSQSLTDLQNAGTADLDRFSSYVTDVRFATRDSHVVPGVTASLNMAAPNAATGDFVVQSVTITDLELTMAKYPLRQVSAADAKFTLTDVLRQVPLAS